MKNYKTRGDKKTAGYTKTNFGKMDLHKLLTEKVLKNPDESFEDWFNRKIKEQFEGNQ